MANLTGRQWGFHLPNLPKAIYVPLRDFAKERGASWAQVVVAAVLLLLEADTEVQEQAIQRAKDLV